MSDKDLRRESIPAPERLLSDGQDSDYPEHHELDWSILMARAQDGDANAYLRLLEEITPYLRRRASRFLVDPRDVEDTVQDILLTIHSIRQTYDPMRPFGPWLVTIANRRAFDRLRRQGRQRLHEIPLTGEHEDVASEADSVERIIDKHKLDGAIESLTPVQQRAIRLVKLKEMSLQEAATETGTSVASLKMAILRALKALRSVLADRSGGQ